MNRLEEILPFCGKASRRLLEQYLRSQSPSAARGKVIFGLITEVEADIRRLDGLARPVDRSDIDGALRNEIAEQVRRQSSRLQELLTTLLGMQIPTDDSETRRIMQIREDLQAGEEALMQPQQRRQGHDMKGRPHTDGESLAMVDPALERQGSE